MSTSSFCWLSLVMGVALVGASVSPEFRDLEWLMGGWFSAHGGKVHWPTIPSMNYGEAVYVLEAPYSPAAGVKFLNFRYTFAL